MARLNDYAAPAESVEACKLTSFPIWDFSPHPSESEIDAMVSSETAIRATKP
jgi:hypothetical protein